MSDDLKPGDLVKLKSGGPTMTYGSKEYASAWCYWFAGTAEKVAKIPLAALKLVVQDER